MDPWPDTTKKEFEAHLEKLSESQVYQTVIEQHTAVQLSARMSLTHFAFISQHLEKTVYTQFHLFIMTCTLGIISWSFNLSSMVFWNSKNDI